MKMPLFKNMKHLFYFCFLIFFFFFFFLLLLFHLYINRYILSINDKTDTDNFLETIKTIKTNMQFIKQEFFSAVTGTNQVTCIILCHR